MTKKIRFVLAVLTSVAFTTTFATSVVAADCESSPDELGPPISIEDYEYMQGLSEEELKVYLESKESKDFTSGDDTDLFFEDLTSEVVDTDEDLDIFFEDINPDENSICPDADLDIYFADTICPYESYYAPYHCPYYGIDLPDDSIGLRPIIILSDGTVIDFSDFGFPADISEVQAVSYVPKTGVSSKNSFAGIAGISSIFGILAYRLIKRYRKDF